MNIRKQSHCYLAIAALCWLLSACASAPEIVEFSMPVPGGEDLVWPSYPDVPRYRYLGDLLGEQNLRQEGQEQVKGLQKFFRWLVGLDDSNQRPNILQRPNNGATGPDGKIYVTDLSRQALMIFDEKLGKIDTWTTISNGVGLKSPVAVAVFNDEVLVSDSEWGRIFRFDKTGTVIGTIGESILKRPTGIAVDSVQGLIYVADTSDDNVKVFDLEGNLTDVIGASGDELGQFNAPTFIALQEGALYISDTLNARIQIYVINDGTFKSVSSRGLYVGDLTRPKGVALDNSGNLYVIESYYDYLLIYDQEGHFLMPIGGSGSLPGEFFQPSGIWIDEHNRIFVADMLNGRVSIFQYLGEN